MGTPTPSGASEDVSDSSATPATDASGAAGEVAAPDALVAGGAAPAGPAPAPLGPFCDGENDGCLPCRGDGWSVPGGDAARSYRTGPAHGIDAARASALRLAYTTTTTSGEALVVGDRILGAHFDGGYLRGASLPPYALELRVADVDGGVERTECRRRVDGSDAGGTGRSALIWQLPVSYRDGAVFLTDPTIPVLSFTPLLPGQFCAYDLASGGCRYAPLPAYSDPPVFAAGTGVYFHETQSLAADGQLSLDYELVAFDADTGAPRARVPVTFDNCGYVRGPRAGLSGPALSADGTHAFVLATECEGPPVRRRLYATSLDGSGGFELLYNAGEPPPDNQPTNGTETAIQMPIVFPKDAGAGSWVALARMDGSFVVIDGDSGAERWRADFGARQATHLVLRYALGGDRFVVLRFRDRDPSESCVPRDCVPVHEAVLAALDRDSGALLWERSVEALPITTWYSDDSVGSVTLPPVTVAGDVGFVAGEQLEVFALDDGAPLFAHPLEGPPSQLPVKAVGGRVFVQAEDALSVFELTPP